MVFAFVTFGLVLGIILGVYWLLIVRPESAQESARRSPVLVGPPPSRKKRRLC